MSGNRILFTLCGRAGSKGIKNKNIQDFVGHPLPLYSLSAIDVFIRRNPEYQCDIAVNTDSTELIEILKNNNMRPVEFVDREPSLAGDKVGKIDVIRSTFRQMEKIKGCRYDAVVDLDITSPLRRESDVENLIRVHFEKNPDVTTSVVPARRNPFFNQVIQTERGVKRVISSNYTSRQEAPMIYDMNASLYAYSPSYLISGSGILDGYCEIIEMMETGVLDLDHKNDLELMEVIADYLFKNNQELNEIRENIR